MKLLRQLRDLVPRRFRRWLADTIMGWASAVLSRLVPNQESFYEGMEERIYIDAYEALKKRDFDRRQEWREDRRPLLWKALGSERTELMLSRLERRIVWERHALGLEIPTQNTITQEVANGTETREHRAHSHSGE